MTDLSAGGPWFRVPRNLPSLEPEEATAWMLLLGLWHGGHDPSIGEMRRRTGWGAGRMTAFMGKVSAWAAENGAALPDRRADLKRTLKSGGDGNVSGTTPERERNVTGTDESAEKADNKVLAERERNDTGTGAECYRNDSRARAPSQRRSDPEETENKIMNMSPPPPAPLFAQPPAAEVSTPAAPKPAAPKPAAPKPAAVDEAEVLAVWTAWKETHRSCKATPPADVAKLIRAALKAHGAETVIAVVRWTQTADHSRARYLRGERNGEILPKEAYGLDTIVRHVGSYDALRAADEAAPAASPRMSALPPGMKPRGPVVLDADTGRPVAPEPPPQKSRGLDLMLDAAERLRKQRELEEEEDRQQQQQEAYDA